MNLRVKELKKKLEGLGFKVEEFTQTTKTAADAAAVLNCDLEQIAKSIVFKDIETQTPILAIVSGKNKVDLTKLENLIHSKLEKADADFVLEKTGFPIGGVPPFGYDKNLKIFLDEDLFQYKTLWAAAGTPNSVFELTPDNLLQLTQGIKVELKL